MRTAFVSFTGCCVWSCFRVVVINISTCLSPVVVFGVVSELYMYVNS